jgi:hypothetical protein
MSLLPFTFYLFALPFFFFVALILVIDVAYALNSV